MGMVPVQSFMEIAMKRKRRTCMCCFNPAAYVSHNSTLALCEECYLSFSDDYEASMEEEYGMSFDEYYDIEELDDDED